MSEEKEVKCNNCSGTPRVDEYGNEKYRYMESIRSENDYGMWLYKTNGKWILRSYRNNGTNEVFVSYCPKCGRSLT